jgi:hypothetical protein
VVLHGNTEGVTLLSQIKKLHLKQIGPKIIALFILDERSHAGAKVTGRSSQDPVRVASSGGKQGGAVEVAERSGLDEV